MKKFEIVKTTAEIRYRQVERKCFPLRCIPQSLLKIPPHMRPQVFSSVYLLFGTAEMNAKWIISIFRYNLYSLLIAVNFTKNGN